MERKDYQVEISGCDMFEDPDTGERYWGDEHYPVKTLYFDTYDDAKEFALGITTEQVIKYEKHERCNSLDACIYEQVARYGSWGEWNLVGHISWVGNTKVEEEVENL